MSHTPIPLGGSMTALATPFKDGPIDEPAFVRLCQRQIDRGTTALIV
jgi:4-hydroxy-tetrahydrodipicolinate synthase